MRLPLVLALLLASVPAAAREIACTEAAFHAEIARINACQDETQGACSGPACSNGPSCSSDADCDCTVATGKRVTFSCADSCDPWTRYTLDTDCLIDIDEALADSTCSASQVNCPQYGCVEVATAVGCLPGDAGDCTSLDLYCTAAGKPMPCCTGLGTGLCECTAGDPAPCTSGDVDCTGAGTPWPDCTGERSGTNCPNYNPYTIREIRSPNVTIDGEQKVALRLTPCCWHRVPEFDLQGEATDLNGWTSVVYVSADDVTIRGLRYTCFWEGVDVGTDGHDRLVLDGVIGELGCDDSASVYSVGSTSTDHVWRNSIFLGGVDKCTQVGSHLGLGPGEGWNVTVSNVRFEDCQAGLGIGNQHRLQLIGSAFVGRDLALATGECYEPWYEWGGPGKGMRDSYVAPASDWHTCGNNARNGSNGQILMDGGSVVHAENTLFDHGTRGGPFITSGTNTSFVSQGCNTFQAAKRHAAHLLNGKMKFENDTFRANGGWGDAAVHEGAINVEGGSVDAGDPSGSVGLNVDGTGDSTGGNRFEGNADAQDDPCHIEMSSSGTTTADDCWWGADSDPCSTDGCAESDCVVAGCVRPNANCQAGSGTLSTLPRLAADPGPCTAVPGTVEGLALDETGLSWSFLAVATSYDVVKGDLLDLRATGGDFESSLIGCLENDGRDLEAADNPDPAAGQGFYYLVRGSVAGQRGTYDSGGSEQIDSRDFEIGQLRSACP